MKKSSVLIVMAEFEGTQAPKLNCILDDTPIDITQIVAYPHALALGIWGEIGPLNDLGYELKSTHWVNGSVAFVFVKPADYFSIRDEVKKLLAENQERVYGMDETRARFYDGFELALETVLEMFKES